MEHGTLGQPWIRTQRNDSWSDYDLNNPGGVTEGWRKTTYGWYPVDQYFSSTTNASMATDFNTSYYSTDYYTDSWYDSSSFNMSWVGNVVFTESQRMLFAEDDYSGFIVHEEGAYSPWWVNKTMAGYTTWWSGETSNWHTGYEYNQATSIDQVAYGYGTIKATREFMLNSQRVRMVNTFTLEKDTLYLHATTKLTNLDDMDIPDVHYFVGFRDNYIGEDNTPDNYRGNIVDAEFVPLSVSNESIANAVMSTSYGEGLSATYYSPEEDANTVLDSCCNLRWGIEVAPQYRDLERLQRESSYGLDLTYGTIAPGSSETQSWYFIAGNEDGGSRFNDSAIASAEDHAEDDDSDSSTSTFTSTTTSTSNGTASSETSDEPSLLDAAGSTLPGMASVAMVVFLSTQ